MAHKSDKSDGNDESESSNAEGKLSERLIDSCKIWRMPRQINMTSN